MKTQGGGGSREALKSAPLPEPQWSGLGDGKMTTPTPAGTYQDLNTLRLKSCFSGIESRMPCMHLAKVPLAHPSPRELNGGNPEKPSQGPRRPAPSNVRKKQVRSWMWDIFLNQCQCRQQPPRCKMTFPSPRSKPSLKNSSSILTGGLPLAPPLPQQWRE